MSPCLPTTGGSLTVWLVGSLLVCGGVYLVRHSRHLVVTALVVLMMSLAMMANYSVAPAVAACSPDNSSLLRGELRVEGGSLSSSELPLMTVTNATTTITARWGTPESQGADTVVGFAFSDITPGEWSLEFTESDVTALNLSHSSWPLVVNSSRLLTGGPLNATTASPQYIPAGGVRLTISVVRS